MKVRAKIQDAKSSFWSEWDADAWIWDNNTISINKEFQPVAQLNSCNVIFIELFEEEKNEEN